MPSSALSPTGDPTLGPAPSDPSTEARGWTQAEIDAEIALLGDVPMYHPPAEPAAGPADPTTPADQLPGGAGSDLTDEIDPDATAVHRPFDLDGPAGADHTRFGAGTTATERLTAYGWLFGDQRRPAGPRPPLWRQPGTDSESDDGPATAPMTPVGVSRAHPVANAVPRPRPAQHRAGTANRAGPRTPHATRRRRRGGRGLLTVLVLAVCLSLGTAAAVVGYRLSGDGAPLAGLTGRGESATPDPDAPQPGLVWDGAVAPIEGVTAEAECVDEPGNDAGAPVPYVPANLLDDDPATAWRCTHDGTPAVTFQLPEDALVAEVGLVNGYAKDVDGTDRYPLYQRALLVRWTFADGTVITQELTDDTRDVQSVRIPVRAAGSVTLEVLKFSNPSVQSATFDAVALSDVVLLAPQT